MSTTRQVLAQLHAFESYRRLGLAKDGSPYGPGFFHKRDWVGTLAKENRRVSIRLSRMGQCIGCCADVDTDSTGDHLVPLKMGGPIGAQNYIPLCRPCNASKGARDFIDWWLSKGRNVADLPNDVIIAYCRLMYRACAERGLLDQTASPHLVGALEQTSSTLSERHQAALSGVGR